MPVLENDRVDTEYRVQFGNAKAVRSDRFREPFQRTP